MVPARCRQGKNKRQITINNFLVARNAIFFARHNFFLGKPGVAAINLGRALSHNLGPSFLDAISHRLHESRS
jgi:sorbitol-specific phosphotransferase system component IIC